jgi:hypothetical protein
MKTCGAVEVWFHAFLPSALDGRELLCSPLPPAEGKKVVKNSLLFHKLTPRSRVLENPTVTQLVKELPVIYGTWRFIIVFRKARQWFLS